LSAIGKIRRLTVPEIRARKGGEPVVCITAYTAPMARFMDPHVDLLLVGDSLGMVLYGFDSTLPVTMEHMIAHTGAVVRGSTQACVILDMPFGSYQESKELAYRNAARAMQVTGCSGVKLEGGAEMAETIRFLTERGVPVMGHVGLLPQSVNTAGGYRIRGRKADEAKRVIADAKAVADAGAFSMVVEGVVEPVARELTKKVSVPTIGIGASAACDGQVLVSEDLLGLFTDFTPKFVKRYADLGSQVYKAVEAYAADVRARRFPAEEHTFGATPKVTNAPGLPMAVGAPPKKPVRG
jgi:3-methyl-2-oxobutanoate hydroxymethyltransferase